jgi:asparagine synthase (glutamine-hydrolysing)
MCGISGFLYQNSENEQQMAEKLRAMCAQLLHRGPDAEGVWLDGESGIGLGHRRLAVVDLSPAGAQPMRSRTGRYVIAFNGEIYNHLNLRATLGLSNWRGTSDTETLLACIEAWGITETIKQSIGMFAIAVWDTKTRILSLCRDRIGEKPLYYGQFGAGSQCVFLFGSDLAALRTHPQFEPTISRDALCTFLRYNCIGQEQSIYEGTYKLPPGTILHINAGGPIGEPEAYWSLESVIANGQRAPFEGSANDAVNHLEALMRDAVGQQMISDVPLGAFLSGGIDSSTVVAMMQAQSNRPVKTFSIGFWDKGFDEAHHAKAVAAHLGTDHTELYVSPDEALAIIPNLPKMYSEPFADSSQIPTALVSQMARNDVTVALSGDAGDELFCGYNRYQLTAKLWGRLGRVPQNIRALAARAIIKANPALLDKLLFFLPFPQVGDKLHKGAALLENNDINALYSGMISQWPNPENIVIGGNERTRPTINSSNLNDIEKMMALDTLTYLTDDILTKVDRAAMAFSLETRVPFLDHRIVEFAWTLPLDYKTRNGIGKWPLRQVLSRYVPNNLIERPKMGFGVPIGNWLRGPLREWGEDLLSPSLIKDQGYFNVSEIRKKWDEHQTGKRNWQHQLWCVLMFQAWHQENSSIVRSFR